jgi:hypothetical protein
VHSFPKRPNLNQLKDAHVIVGAPRGFESLTDTSLNKLLELSNAGKRLIVDSWRMKHQYSEGTVFLDFGIHSRISGVSERTKMAMFIWACRYFGVWVCISC